MAGEDPSIFAIAPETLAVKAFGDMGQTASFRLIRDRFIAGHNSCELRRHLDSVPPYGIFVDQCRVWESHADSDVRRISKPGPDPTFPTYVVGKVDRGVEDLRVAAVTTPQSTPDQVEKLVRRLMATPAPEPPAVEQLLQRLVAETQVRQPVPAAATGSAGLETLPRTLLSGNLAPAQQPRLGSFRRDWNAVVCFSCGKAGHSATWTAEKTAGGYAMISPRIAAEHRRAKNGDCPGGGGRSPPGSGGGGGGTTRLAAPREGVAAWTGAPPLITGTECWEVALRSS